LGERSSKDCGLEFLLEVLYAVEGFAQPELNPVFLPSLGIALPLRRRRSPFQSREGLTFFLELLLELFDAGQGPFADLLSLLQATRKLGFDSDAPVGILPRFGQLGVQRLDPSGGGLATRGQRRPEFVQLAEGARLLGNQVFQAQQGGLLGLFSILKSCGQLHFEAGAAIVLASSLGQLRVQRLDPFFEGLVRRGELISKVMHHLGVVSLLGQKGFPSGLDLPTSVGEVGIPLGEHLLVGEKDVRDGLEMGARVSRGRIFLRGGRLDRS
jgi:hypothetical protein